jgi:F-type H+-transporting ATPase subunit alpha
MKKVAGKLRLQLAAFRELANFMQFGSDLDEATSQQIEKGKRLTELLKQKNSNPIPTYKQAVLLYAGINDYLNEIPLTSIQEFEDRLYRKLDKNYKHLAKNLQTQQALTEELEKEIIKLIKEIVKEMTAE